MRVVSIGGGPGGLLLSILLKVAAPDHEVTVIERNAADATFGFGVVLSDRTLDELAHAEPLVYQRLREASAYWTDIEVRHPARTMRCGGNGFAAIARVVLLRILQERAAEVGVVLRFGEEVTDLAHLADHDLVVAGDGVNSGVRASHPEWFGPRITMGRARFAWFGTTQSFDALTFIFEENEHGAMAVHAYPMARSDGASTFIIETDAETLRRAGLDGDRAPLPPGESDLESLAYCEKLFAEHLGGHGLLVNNSKWLSFPTVQNDRWHHDNVVLIGDAAHTAHFSVGSGTRMAMEDAIALAGALAEQPGVPAALVEFERRRRPDVKRVQDASAPSLEWWEAFRSYLPMEPEQFAFHFLTRSRRVTHGNLRMRDRGFVRTVERWFSTAQLDAHDGDRPPTRPPLSAPLRLGSLVLPSRVVVGLLEPAPGAPGLDQPTLVGLAGAAAHGAGLVMTPPLTTAPDESHAALVTLTRLVADPPVAAGLQLAVDGLDPEALAGMAEAGALAGFDVVSLAVAMDAMLMGAVPTGAVPTGAVPDAGAAEAAVAAVRAAWPQGRPVLVQLTTHPGRVEIDDQVVALARRLAAAGCDVVGVAVPAGPPDLRLATAQMVLCDRIRHQAGVRTMMVGGVLSDDDATTLVLAGRADLCWGRPQLASPHWRHQ